ncbi:hypothetical protein, partial [Salmonella sp. s51933]|uniref:hypothetical protein n=1 Tax=Salmonella sp. s51933 TaxID=3160127 RepID=UPI0037540B60
FPDPPSNKSCPPMLPNNNNCPPNLPNNNNSNCPPNQTNPNCTPTAPSTIHNNFGGKGGDYSNYGPIANDAIFNFGKEK